MRIAETTNVTHSRPERIVLGRHLLELGHLPARWFSSILDACYQAQLDGVFEEEAGAIDFLKSELAKSNSALNTTGHHPKPD